MKKLLFLLTIVLTLFTVVYATEADLLISPAPDAAEETANETVENVEVVEGEDSHEEHDHGEEVVPEDTTNVEIEHDHDHDHAAETASGTTVVGAIIAIVIVVAVIGLVALLQKQ